MSALGRWVCAGDGLADGAVVGSVATDAGALAFLPAAEAAIPAAGVGAWDVAAAVGLVWSVGLLCAVEIEGGGVAAVVLSCPVLDTVGVTDTFGLVAPVGEAAELPAAGLDLVAVTVGDGWLSVGAVD
jgi:hypothetical protein